MAILWCGGEDIDFPNGSTLSIGTTSTNRRSSYSRCDISNSNANSTSARSPSFAGGAVTSAWLHCQAKGNNSGTSKEFIGLGLNSAGQAALALGCDSASATKLALWKYSGGTWTELASEAGNSISTSALQQLDMHVSSFGASATVDVYINSTLAFTYSGSTTVTGVTNLDCVAIVGNATTPNMLFSEIIVADEDTRAMSLATLGPNAAGDSTGSWTNTYTSINPTTINDANAIYNNATGSDFQANLLDLPAGSFTIKACKAVARAEVTAGATPTGFKLGIKSGGTVNVDAGHSPGAAFVNYERLMTTNPVTSAAFTQTEVNALQLDVQSM
jgi:hypothetical protein